MSLHRTESAPLRVGFVGTQHPHILQRARLLSVNSRVEVVGFFEQDPVLADQTEKELALARFSSLEALLDRNLDLAIIEALDPDVAELSATCVGRVAAILIEKPGAQHPDAIFDLAKACREAGTIVEFGYEMHYAQCMTVLKSIVSSGCIGQVTLARIHGGCPVGCALELWQSLSQDLGGLGYTEGCHIIELALDLFGVPAATSALMTKLPAGEIVSSPYFKSALFGGSGASVDVQVGTCMYEDVMTGTLIYPDKIVTVDLTAWEAGNWVKDWAIQIYGTNGTVSVDLGSEEVHLVLREARADFRAGATTWTDDHSGLGYMFERQLESVIRRIAGLEVDESVDLDAGVAVLRVLRAMYESAGAAGSTRSIDG